MHLKASHAWEEPIRVRIPTHTQVHATRVCERISLQSIIMHVASWLWTTIQGKRDDLGDSPGGDLKKMIPNSEF